MRRNFNKEHLIWRKRVIDRDGGCVVCGKTGKYMNAHHLIPANFIKYQFELNNGLTLCAGCHTLAKFSAHKNPIWFCKWLAKNKSELYWIAIDRLQELEDG